MIKSAKHSRGVGSIIEYGKLKFIVVVVLKCHLYKTKSYNMFFGNKK